MTAYTSLVSGDVNVATNWSPTGIPTSADTVTINRMMTIPAGYTFSAAITNIAGTSNVARAGFNVYGTLQLTANASLGVYNENNFKAGCVFDGLGSFGFRYAQGSTNVNNKITVSGTQENPVIFTRSDWVSGEPAPLISMTTTTSAVAAFVDATYLTMKNMASILWGGGSAGGNHFRMRNCVWDDAGFFKTGGISNLADDWIMENCDYRHSNIAAISSAYPMELIATRDTSGTPTGTKRFKGNTFKVNTETSTKYIRFYSVDGFQPIDYVSDGIQLQLDSTNTGINYEGICQRFATDVNFSTFGGLLASTTFKNCVTLIDASDYVVTGSFHGFQSKKFSAFEDNYIEEIFLQTGLDGSDWYAPPLTGNASIKGNTIVLENGGVFVNSWTGNTASNITIDHNTIVSRYSAARASDPYGTLARTESGNNFTGGNNVVTSNLVWIISTAPSSDKIIAAINFTGTALADQIDFMDNNNYYNMSPTPPTGLFPGVVITGKVQGDIGFGANDSYHDPMMLNWPTAHRNSPLTAFAVSKGVSTTKQLWALLLRRNGFNETTRKQESAHVISYGAPEILAFCRNCVKPSNPLLATSAYDGTSKGAVQFTVSPPGGGIAFQGLSAAGISSSGLAAVGL